MANDVTLVKEKVCIDCLSPHLLFKDCQCTYMRNYPVIELEFERCNCCNNVSSYPAKTEFNKQQLKTLQ